MSQDFFIIKRVRLAVAKIGDKFWTSGAKDGAYCENSHTWCEKNETIPLDMMSPTQWTSPEAAKSTTERCIAYKFPASKQAKVPSGLTSANCTDTLPYICDVI